MYLREVGGVPLLSAEEEVRLVRRMELGNLEQFTGASLRVYRNIEDGEEAQRRLAEVNLRLVVSVAKMYIGRGLSLLNLIQKGNIDLMRTVERFDYTKGFKVSIFATWWIRQAITRALADHMCRYNNVLYHTIIFWTKPREGKRESYQFAIVVKQMI